ncbi:hypothetical protein VNO80_27065 [Phaseolus coccineus]|uniref:Uncharacterized protein n=1 Tax=Phaseolus coccineus TaxID=3886 RepID=A0AAN9LJ67_PHACN
MGLGKAHSVSPQYSCGRTTTTASTIIECPYRIDSIPTLLRFSPLLSISIIPIILTPCLQSRPLRRRQPVLLLLPRARNHCTMSINYSLPSPPSLQSIRRSLSNISFPQPDHCPFNTPAASSLSPTASPNSEVEEAVDEGEEEAKEDTEKLEAVIVAMAAVERVCQCLPVVVFTAEETGCIQKQNPNSIN